ncbi:hypothetical protein QZM64_41830, partial [Burkholderia cepacia]|nr:hypothetical protein [Burkholderia cepacia]
QASCGGSPWFPVREVGPGNPILSDSTGEPPPSTFNYAWDIAQYDGVCSLSWKSQRSSTRAATLLRSSTRTGAVPLSSWRPSAWQSLQQQ